MWLIGWRVLVGQGVLDAVELGVHRAGVGLVIDGVQQCPHPRPAGLGAGGHQVGGVVGPAALPGRTGQGRADRVDQPAVGVGGDQRDPGQAAGGQVPEEAQPAGAVLGAGDLQAEDLPVPVAVDPGGQQGVHVDHPAAFVDLQHQRVGGHERVGTLVQPTGAERLDLAVKVAGHLRDLRLAQPRDAQGLDQFLHPPCADPEQVAGRHHRGQRPLCPPAAFQQPVREVGTRPQLRDRHVQRPGAGVEVSVPVTVAGVDPLAAAPAVLGTADGVGLSRHQRVDEGAQQLPQQIRRGLGELLGQKRAGSILLGAVIASFSWSL